MSWFPVQRIHRKPLTPEEQRIVDDLCYSAVKKAISQPKPVRPGRMNKLT